MTKEQIAAFTVRIDGAIIRLQRIHFWLFVAMVIVVWLFEMDTTNYCFTKKSLYLWMLVLHVSTFTFAAFIRRRVARSIHFTKLFQHHSLCAIEATDFDNAQRHHAQAIAAIQMI